MQRKSQQQKHKDQTLVSYGYMTTYTSEGILGIYTHRP